MIPKNHEYKVILGIRKYGITLIDRQRMRTVTVTPSYEHDCGTYISTNTQYYYLYYTINIKIANNKLSYYCNTVRREEVNS